jgi:magnesium chelatase accessory protein
MGERLQWQREGRDWPHRESSRFVTAGGVQWHVQCMPYRNPKSQSTTGPDLLLIHGTGASTHSWRGLMQRLSRKFHVVAPDLPGHGFSGPPSGHNYSLTGMSKSLGALLKKLDVNPEIVVGHSAGAAILLQMCVDGYIKPRHIISLNGALLPLNGLPGEIFSPLAKLLSRSSLVPRFFAWRATDPIVLDRLLSSTGSSIDPHGAQLYGALISNQHHAAAALKMMAQWDLRPLKMALPTLADGGKSLTVVVAENDRTVSPREAQRVQALLPAATVVTLKKLGHLAHEENPDQICELVENLEMH